MQDHGGDEPQHDRSTPRRDVERSAAAPRRTSGSSDQVREQVQRRRAVARSRHAARNVIAPTHFVLCTPGSAGTMIRAG